ncbi:ovostatin [Bombina bombina]|uniref:ovostatin n=1 Tax=Bombina bombina TaxID=8345 RepID=UPI00235AA0E6|nr:ovostatin [Bombina bombina]
MYLCRSLLSVFLLSLIPGGRSEPQYALILPAVLKSGQTEKVCVNLVGHEEALSLDVVLQLNGVNTTIFDEDVPATNYYQCNKFSVPIIQDSGPVFVIFSAAGETVKLLGRKSVGIDKMEDIYKIQMDKPIYKPGNKVLFRILSLNSEIKPVKTKYPVIYLKDPSGSRIAQWLDQESEHGIVSLEIQLIPDATIGYYRITAERESGYPVYHGFSVEEIVLPRYSISVSSPSTLSILDETLTFNVTAMYTYGQPVPGSVTVRCCRNPGFRYGRKQNCYRNKDGFCANITGQLGPDGTFRGVVDLSLFSLELSKFQTSFNLDLVVTEEGTGNQVRETRYVSVTSELASVQFDYEAMNPHYRRGIPYTVVVILKDQSDQPMANEEIELEVDVNTIKLMTDAVGKAKYEIDTSSFAAPNFTIKANYLNPDQCYYPSWRDYPDYPTAEFTVQRFYSQSGSFVQGQPPKERLKCGQSYSIDVKYILTAEGVGAEATKATFYYLVMARSEIVANGQKDVDVSGSRNGTVTIDLSVSSDMAPSATIIIYSILEKEIIVETVSLNIETCFRNLVSLNFSEEQGAPSSNVDLLFSAAPESLCAFRVIDESLRLLRPYEPFTAESIYNSMRYTSLYGYYVGGVNLEDPAPPCDDPNKQVFYNGHYYVPVSSWNEGDSYSKIKAIGLVFGTETRLRKPVVCGMEDQDVRPLLKEIALESSASDRLGSVAGGGGGSIETVRKNFSDIWFWGTSSAASDGTGSVTLVVPDSITSWEGSMFCVSDKEGFGMIPDPAKFTSFLPFFVELSLPYSIVRGETLVLRAFVPNYLVQCIKVHVTMESSPDFDAEPQDVPQDVCICPRERASYTWNLVPKKIGDVTLKLSAETSHIGATCDGPSDSSQPSRKDTVIQKLLVEPEGIKKEATSSNLICVQDSNSQTPITLSAPESAVPDSQLAFVTVVPDPLGLPLQNLENLIQMPHGCAEQNLARIATIVYVLEYLNATGQLTPEILEKGKRFLAEGYIRQLGFRWNNGYVTFAGIGQQANSGLTANTFKIFERAKKFIYIDKNVQEQTLLYLSELQTLETGCFKRRGDLFMPQGDKEDDLIYTILLTIALLESDYSSGKTMLEGALACVVEASKSEQSTYIQTMMLYVFTLAEKSNERDNLLNILKQKAVTQAGAVHWERPDRQASPYFSSWFTPLEVEMSSYVLLSVAKGPNVLEADLTYMATVALWLVRQQNSYGGFRTTQDTTVALQALSAYAALIFTPNAQHNVIVKQGNGQLYQLSLNQDNRLLVQRQPLPTVPGEYSVDVSGNGCCLVQSTLRYYLPVSQQNAAFSLSVNSSAESCVNGVAYTFTIGISVSYQGSREQSNMAIIDLKMQSGYTPDYSSLRELVNSKVVSKTESQNGHVILYLNSVSKQPISMSLKVEMGNRVLNVQEATVLVYDYYEPDENGAAKYRHPCVAQD